VNHDFEMFVGWLGWFGFFSTDVSDCFDGDGLITYVFGMKDDAKEVQIETSECEIRPNKKSWMMEALGLKYANPFFRDLLLNSKDGIYERKGPRDTKLWCGNEYTEDAVGEPTAGLLIIAQFIRYFP